VLADFFQQLSAIHPPVGHLAKWAVIGVLLTIALFLIAIPAHISPGRCVLRSPLPPPILRGSLTAQVPWLTAPSAGN
jgi:hypothetical protein